ncbi:hypothetical protein JCM3770_004358 [Rhodotorula araucariae]
MFSLLAAPISRIASFVMTPLSGPVTRSTAAATQTSLRTEFTQITRRAPRHPGTYSSSTLAHGSPVSRSTVRRVGGTFPKPTPPPFPSALAVQPLAALVPVLCRPEVTTAALASGYQERVRTENSACSRTSAPTPPEPRPTPSPPSSPSTPSLGENDLCVDTATPETRLGYIPEHWIATLTRSGIYKALVLRDWLDDNESALGTEGTVTAALRYGVKFIDLEERLERELDAAATCCPPKWSESEVCRDKRLNDRIEGVMYTYLAEMQGIRLVFTPARVPRRRRSRTFTPPPPSPLAGDCTSSLLLVEAPVEPAVTGYRAPRSSRLASAPVRALLVAAKAGHHMHRWAVVNAFIRR